MKIKHSYYLAFILVVISILIFGCAPAAQPAAQPATPSTSPAAQTKEPIKITYIGTLGIPTGKSGVAAAQIAVDEINKEGGILGRQVVLLTGDNKGEIPLTTAAYKKAVLTDLSTLVFVEGSAHVLACMEVGVDLFKEYPHIQVGVWCAADGITEKVVDNYDTYKFFFRAHSRNSTITPIYNNAFMNVLKKSNATKVAILIEDAEYTLAYRKGAPGFPTSKEQYEKAGFEVVLNETVSTTEKMWLPILEKVASSGAQGMVWTCVYPDLITLAKQWALSAAKDLPIMNNGGAAALGKAFWDSTGGAALGWVSPSMTVPNIKITDKTQPFMKKMAEANASAFDNAYNVYESLLLFKIAMEKAGSAEKIDSIIKAAEETEVTGVTGIMKFEAKSHSRYYPIENSGYPYYTYWFAQYQNNGDLVIIEPKEVVEKSNPGKGYVHIKELRAQQK